MSIAVAIEARVGTFRLSAAFAAQIGLTVLFGASGAGKTSVLKMIAGTRRPDSGYIIANGRTLFDAERGIDIPPSRRGIGYVFQDGRLFPHLNVRHNLTYARWAGGRPAVRSFSEVVDLLGLVPLLERQIVTLSGGERQRVAIGRALLSAPDILLMDEPLSSLDRPRRAEIMPYLEAVRAETRIPILYVSHDPDEVARLADTIVFLEAGRTIAFGPAAEMFPRLLLDGGDTDPGVLIEGVVEALDHVFGIAEIAFDGGRIEIADTGLGPGARVRLRIHARDVAVALVRPEATSIRNAISCQVVAIRPLDKAHALVDLAAGGVRLGARLTQKSVAELGLERGLQVMALVKAASVERHGAGRQPAKTPPCE
jgi:molybdate transport system ATP-binding protein